MQEPRKEKFGCGNVGKMSGGESDTDNQGEEMFVVIFATAGNLSHLGRVDVWYGEGIFPVCPNLFYQL